MRNLLVMAVSVALVFVAACSKPQKWERSEIAGYNFSMVSDKVVRSYTFADSGSVDVESGKIGAPLTKKSYSWLIDDKGALVIKENANKEAGVISVVTKLGQSGDSFKVSTAEGRELTFIRKKAAEGQPAQ